MWTRCSRSFGPEHHLGKRRSLWTCRPLSRLVRTPAVRSTRRIRDSSLPHLRLLEQQFDGFFPFGVAFAVMVQLGWFGE